MKKFTLNDVETRKKFVSLIILSVKQKFFHILNSDHRIQTTLTCLYFG